MYIPKEVKNVTGGCGGVKSYLSKEGDFTKSIDTQDDFKPTFGGYPTISPFFTSIEVLSSEKNRSIIAFGDSITTLSWPDYLAQKLNDGNIKNLSVVREAISGNRILHDTVSMYSGMFGESGISRFEKSITDHENAKYVIVLQGINDIVMTGPGGPAEKTEKPVSKDELISGLQQYIDLAHKHNLKIYGATIMPFGGYSAYTTEEEDKRQEVNDWIRNSGKFDAVIDVDKATLDPNNPTKLLPEYDLGDHLHPSDEGSQAIVKGIDLNLFK